MMVEKLAAQTVSSVKGLILSRDGQLKLKAASKTENGFTPSMQLNNVVDLSIS